MALSTVADVSIYPRPVAGSLADIVYENESGMVSTRRIRVVRVHPARNGHVYLRAYCFFRREERTFRLDRVRHWTAVSPTSEAPARAVTIYPAARPAWPVLAARPTSPPAAVTVAPSAVAPSRTSRSASRSGRGVGGIFLGVLAIGLLKLIFGGQQESHYVPSVPLAPPVVSRPVSEPGVQPAKKPAATPVPRKPGRAESFRAATGIQDASLERLYERADLDGSGSLSWPELAQFQAGLKGSSRYLANVTVLRPDEFLARGGGDCDDWATFTCGLLRYWGWEAWVGCFEPPSAGNGHAMCMVRLNRPPGAMEYYAVPEGCRLATGPARAGYYVPVDYEVVGGTSNAIGEGWTLHSLYVAESIYGDSM